MTGSLLRYYMPTRWIHDHQKRYRAFITQSPWKVYRREFTIVTGSSLTFKNLL